MPVSAGATTENALHSSVLSDSDATISASFPAPKASEKNEKISRKVRTPTATNDLGCSVGWDSSSPTSAPPSSDSVIRVPPMTTSRTLRPIEKLLLYFGVLWVKRMNGWFGLTSEMTGLDVTRESIIEIATVVTDGQLNILATGPNLAVSVPSHLLDEMDEWNTSHHTASGLVERVRSQGVSCEDAERQTLEFLRNWVPEGSAPLCGSSVYPER